MVAEGDPSGKNVVFANSVSEGSTELALSVMKKAGTSPRSVPVNRSLRSRMLARLSENVVFANSVSEGSTELALSVMKKAERSARPRVQ